MVAISDSPIGPFKHVGVVDAGSSNRHVGDMNVFKDTDGSAYVIYDDTGFDIRIDRLSDDYLTSNKDGILLMSRKPLLWSLQRKIPSCSFRCGRF
jgi:hypothetical protein